MARLRTRVRDAITGKFTSKKKAAENPDTTVTETVEVEESQKETKVLGQEIDRRTPVQVGRDTARENLAAEAKAANNS